MTYGASIELLFVRGTAPHIKNLLGTPVLFNKPEQWQFAEIDVVEDINAIGEILFKERVMSPLTSH
jgi:hypothetical protein